MKIELLKNIIKETVKQAVKESIEEILVENNKQDVIPKNTSIFTPTTPTTTKNYESLSSLIEETRRSISPEEVSNLIGGSFKPAAPVSVSSGGVLNLNELSILKKAGAINKALIEKNNK